MSLVRIWPKLRFRCLKLIVWIFLLIVWIFLIFFQWKMHQVMSDPNYPGSDSNKSAKRGVCPPVWHQERWHAGSTSEAANAVAHVTLSIRVHLRSHRRPTWNRMNDGASCAFACDNSLNTSTDSSLHRPPVSMAMTMSLHRPEVANSGYAVSLSVRASPTCVCVGFTFTSQHAAESDVHGQLHASITRQVLRKHLNLPCVICTDIDVHVPQKNVLPDRRSCFPEDAARCARSASPTSSPCRFSHKTHGVFPMCRAGRGILHSAHLSTAMANRASPGSMFGTDAKEW